MKDNQGKSWFFDKKKAIKHKMNISIIIIIIMGRESFATTRDTVNLTIKRDENICCAILRMGIIKKNQKKHISLYFKDFSQNLALFFSAYNFFPQKITELLS